MKTKDADGNELKVGDIVDVYGLNGCRGDIKTTSRIEDIAPMFNGGENMLWIDRVRGAWSSKAVRKTNNK